MNDRRADLIALTRHSAIKRTRDDESRKGIQAALEQWDADVVTAAQVEERTA
jgi:hypothetical protein